MHCNNTTIGTCNAVKTETIDGGAVENGPSLYSWESQWRRVMLTRVTSAAPLVLHLIAWERWKMTNGSLQRVVWHTRHVFLGILFLWRNRATQLYSDGSFSIAPPSIVSVFAALHVPMVVLLHCILRSCTCAKFSLPAKFQKLVFPQWTPYKRVQNGGKKYYGSDVTLICISLKYFSLCATGLLVGKLSVLPIRYTDLTVVTSCCVYDCTNRVKNGSVGTKARFSEYLCFGRGSRDATIT